MTRPLLLSQCMCYFEGVVDGTCRSLEMKMDVMITVKTAPIDDNLGIIFVRLSKLAIIVAVGTTKCCWGWMSSLTFPFPVAFPWQRVSVLRRFVARCCRVAVSTTLWYS